MKMLLPAQSFAVALAVLLLLSPITGSIAAAASRSTEVIPVFGLSQQDLDGDGLPDVTIIDSSFATERDRVLVYDRKGNMRTGIRWEEVTDFDDDIWIFDKGADDDAQLIIAFAQENGNQMAYLYVDENGDGRVSYEVTGKDVRITESPYWRLKIAAPGSWLLPDGRPNPHVAISIDGITQRLLDSYVGLTKGWLKFATDGKVDWEIESVDQDGDGEADYVLTRLQTEVPDYFNAFRSSLVVDRDPSPAQPKTIPIFWPYLFAAEGANNFAKTPAVVVDWGTGTIPEASILGFHTEQSYEILSSAPSWRKGQVNDVLWENPKAYYDLAGDRDGQSEMYIRMVQPLWLDADPDRPLSADQFTIQYFWDQDDNRRYDYRVTVAGRKPFTHTIEFPDFAVRTVPYEVLPSWIGEQKWDAAFLLVGEAGGQGGGEGLMWTWEGWNALATDYLSGYIDEAPPTLFQEIEAGYRGEYSLAYAQPPVLYFSPLDQRLHLYAAQDGIWNLGGGRAIRYANLDGDAYLDQWREESDEEMIQQVNYGHGVYALSGHGEVQIKQANVAPALFETQPPTNQATWRQLDAELKTHPRDLAPEDFAGMLSWLEGRETHIQGASLRDYRLTPQGFRFILELQAGFAVDGDVELLGPLPDAPGSYVVAYDSGAWSVRPATPVSLRAGDLDAEAQDGELNALDWATLGATLHNAGTEDGHDLPVCALLDGPGGQQTVMTDTLGLLPGEGQQRVAWDWAPPAAGEWRVRLAANCDGSEDDVAAAQLLAETTLQVGDHAQPSPGWLVSLGGSVHTSIALFGIAVAVVATLAATAWRKGAAD